MSDFCFEQEIQLTATLDFFGYQGEYPFDFTFHGMSGSNVLNSLNCSTSYFNAHSCTLYLQLLVSHMKYLSFIWNVFSHHMGTDYLWEEDLCKDSLYCDYFFFLEDECLTI